MLVHILKESNHRRSVTNVHPARLARTGHPPSLQQPQSPLAEKGDRDLVEANDGPFLGYEGAIVGG